MAATAVTEGVTSSNTPAVSARILKKRETDRRCQRMIRERTKSRISYLEGLVEQFRQQDSSGRVETLMKQLSDMKEERDVLAKKVKNIESIISDSRLKEEPDIQDLALTKLPSRNNDSHTSSLSIDTYHDTRYPSPTDDLTASSPGETPPGYTLHNKEYQAYVESSSRSSWAASAIQPGPNQPCECSAHRPALDPTQTLNKWRYANDTLTEWFKWSPQALDMSKFSAYNDDVPVRAMVEGWDAVERRGRMHPAWRLLRGIDEHLFSTCDKRERLAILTVMGLLLQTHLNPTTEQHKKLPSFYLKRPSQDMLHSYATEYFAWPGLRERFVFSEHRYCSNIFWHLFCKCLRFQWAYEFRDCYVHNTDTGLYKISPTFHHRVHDIRSWTMGMDMFKQYPELYGDIPAWNHIPTSVSPIVHVHGHAQRALPSTERVDDSSKTSNPYDSKGLQSPKPNHMHGQPIYPQYSIPPSTGSFSSDTAPMSSYDFRAPSVATPANEIQQFPPLTNWGYNGSIDVFPLNPA